MRSSLEHPHSESAQFQINKIFNEFTTHVIDMALQVMDLNLKSEAEDEALGSKKQVTHINELVVNQLVDLLQSNDAESEKKSRKSRQILDITVAVVSYP